MACMHSELKEVRIVQRMTLQTVNLFQLAMARCCQEGRGTSGVSRKCAVSGDISEVK